MADLCCEYPFPGFVINDETPDVDRLVLAADGLTGLDGAPIRRQIDPKGQADGGILHTARLGPRVVLFRGFLDIRTVQRNTTSEYFTAVNTLEAAVIAGLETIRNADHVLTWTPTGLSAHSLTVRYGTPGNEIRFPGSMLTKQFQFAVVAADPTIS